MDRNTILKYFDENRAYADKKIAEGTEKNRKGDFELVFADDAEKTVTLRQVGHTFKFGCNAFMLGCFESEEKEKKYIEKFVDLFNLAVVPFYWDGIEPREGTLRFGKDAEPVYRRPAPDTVLEFCKKYGIEPKGHCLLWAYGLPEWLQKYGEREKKRLTEKRFAEISARYAGQIPSFDIINESGSTYAVGKKRLFEDYEEFALDLGAKYFAGNVKFLNEASDYIWYYARPRGGKCIPFTMQAEKLLGMGKKIDALGMQYHLFFREQRLAEDEILNSYLDPVVLLDVLETLGKFGLPMQISEVTVPSYFGTGKENEEVQAEVIEELYRLWFSVAGMEGIDYWNLVDGYAAFARQGSAEGENYYGGGLMGYDLCEKPAYRVLDKLINHEWKTSAEGKNVRKSFSFRGFYGTYEAEVRTAEKTEKFTLELSHAGKYAVGRPIE